MIRRRSSALTKDDSADHPAISPDQDRGKGATEENPQSEGKDGNTSMQGQLGHRGEDDEIKDVDSGQAG